MTAVLLVPYATIVDPPPPERVSIPEFKTEKAKTLMSPLMWKLAVSVSPCSKEMVITASQNGRHRRDSQHYRKRALDFRTRHLTKKERTRFEGCARAVLGDSYFVKLEPNHLHVALLGEPE